MNKGGGINVIQKGKKFSILILMMIAFLLICLWPIVSSFGQLFYFTFMPRASVELAPGRNALFLTLMKGKYVLKIVGENSKKKPNGFSVKGQIRTSTSTNEVNNGNQYLFECNRNLERADILLDLQANCAEKIHAVVFPVK